jgi:hypothetical protein
MKIVNLTSDFQAIPALGDLVRLKELKYLWELDPQFEKKINDTTRAEAIRILNSLEPCGGTNLLSGLYYGLDTTKRVRTINKNTQLIFLSDGQDSNAAGGYAHTAAFALVDKEGYVRGVYLGTDPKEVDKLEIDLRKLLKYEYDIDIKLNH